MDSFSTNNGGTSIPWTYKTWIANFKGVDLPIGDLAKSIEKDPYFPKVDSFGTLLEHISDDDFLAIVHEHVSPKVRKSQIIETFCTVWAFYLSSK
ncbi:hypothetical protein M670_00488 [Schinkia azotoformans MEV2011]|uniref:Uncharacterized protein n=1 Tax=Schinkia azotoformans MEV2011 TaxID=1348973 RepID=A0A072NTA5_SCHAZ|nr:YozE family protein [Schinkia azotoformans]KEF40462.1 hypothetical protein M670_00488 [Schinkia azotoformans MEV2011]MEC1696129.1 YozE family protein [Schinkia azotoformans]MEC1716656.1 YozE family protein [Schinkia azotoformans]MEC1725368.1 YozE family protein [Schinkia azotoformans]MEC1739495.1 YozE family protein [Schinkia azotoformans]